MIIDLANVGLTPKRVEQKFDSSKIDLEGEYAILTGEARFNGETQRIDSKAHIRGTIEANFSLDCTRCLEPVVKRIEVSFDDVFVDAADETRTVETEVGIEELNVSLAQGGQIDLTEIVREQILLALPDQIFCREDCKGLCPKCGENRNLIDCKCTDEEIDPRWEALKELK